jgi:hypothetical protein
MFNAGLVPWIRDSLKKDSLRLLRAETETSHLVEDLVGGLGPLEGLPLLVVGVHVGGDGSAKLRDTGVRSPSERNRTAVDVG